MHINEVVDKIVYHGNQGGIHREFVTPMWWTENKEDAIYYSTQSDGDGWVYSARLNCNNPYNVGIDDEPNTLISNWKNLASQGYDSIHDSKAGDWIPFYAKDIQLLGEPEYFES